MHWIVVNGLGLLVGAAASWVSMHMLDPRGQAIDVVPLFACLAGWAGTVFVLLKLFTDELED